MGNANQLNNCGLLNNWVECIRYVNPRNSIWLSPVCYCQPESMQPTIARSNNITLSILLFITSALLPTKKNLF